MHVRAARLDDSADIARVHLAGWRENYRGILEDARIERHTLASRTATWHAALAEPQRIVLVACDEHETIVGFASALRLAPARDGFDAYLQALYFTTAAKGRGGGRALLRALAQHLIRAAAANMALRVLRNNAPARVFYERLGARLVPEGCSIEAGGFDDLVYAFDDLRALL